MVRGSYKYDRTIARYIESPSWSYFAEEYVCYSLPEEEGGLINYV